MGVSANKKVKGGKIGVGKGGANATVGGKRGSVNVGKKGVKAKAKIPGTGISGNGDICWKEAKDQMILT